MFDRKTFAFQPMQPKRKGAPSFQPAILRKLYFNGYSTAGNWKKKVSNPEMRWLCEGQARPSIQDNTLRHCVPAFIYSLCRRRNWLMKQPLFLLLGFVCYFYIYIAPKIICTS
jgi:hypothetical protein